MNNSANSPLGGQIAFTNNGTVRLTTSKQYDHLNRLTAAATLNAPLSALTSFNTGTTTPTSGCAWTASQCR